jgi:hypothetical protein
MFNDAVYPELFNYFLILKRRKVVSINHYRRAERRIRMKKNITTVFFKCKEKSGTRLHVVTESVLQ